MSNMPEPNSACITALQGNRHASVCLQHHCLLQTRVCASPVALLQGLHEAHGSPSRAEHHDLDLVGQRAPHVGRVNSALRRCSLLLCMDDRSNLSPITSSTDGARLRPKITRFEVGSPVACNKHARRARQRTVGPVASTELRRSYVASHQRRPGLGIGNIAEPSQ